jgi:hypothetical protein
LWPPPRSPDRLVICVCGVRWEERCIWSFFGRVSSKCYPKNSSHSPVSASTCVWKHILTYSVNGLDSLGPRYCPTADVCKHSSEPWSSIKVGNFITGWGTTNFWGQILLWCAVTVYSETVIMKLCRYRMCNFIFKCKCRYNQ